MSTPTVKPGDLVAVKTEYSAGASVWHGDEAGDTAFERMRPNELATVIELGSNVARVVCGRFTGWVYYDALTVHS